VHGTGPQKGGAFCALAACTRCARARASRRFAQHALVSALTTPTPRATSALLAGAAKGTNWGYVVRDGGVGGVEHNARMDIEHGSSRYVIWVSQVRYRINTKEKLVIGSVHTVDGRAFTVLRELAEGTAAQKKALAAQLAPRGAK